MKRPIRLELVGMFCKDKNAQAAGEPDTGETYYHHWLVTLEQHGRREWRDLGANSGAALPKTGAHAVRETELKAEDSGQ